MQIADEMVEKKKVAEAIAAKNETDMEARAEAVVETALGNAVANKMAAEAVESAAKALKNGAGEQWVEMT